MVSGSGAVGSHYGKRGGRFMTKCHLEGPGEGSGIADGDSKDGTRIFDWASFLYL